MAVLGALAAGVLLPLLDAHTDEELPDWWSRLLFDGDARRLPDGARCRVQLVTRLDERTLLQAALRANAVIEVDVYPGCFLVSGVPVGHAWPSSGGDLDGATREELLPGTAGFVRTGLERTVTQVVGYGLRQLTDVANNALSPTGAAPPAGPRRAPGAVEHCRQLGLGRQRRNRQPGTMIATPKETLDACTRAGRTVPHREPDDRCLDGCPDDG